MYLRTRTDNCLSLSLSHTHTHTHTHAHTCTYARMHTRTHNFCFAVCSLQFGWWCRQESAAMNAEQLRQMEVILSHALSPDNNIRAQAERVLHQHMQNNRELFVFGILKLMRSSDQTQVSFSSYSLFSSFALFRRNNPYFILRCFCCFIIIFFSLPLSAPPYFCWFSLFILSCANACVSRSVLFPRSSCGGSFRWANLFCSTSCPRNCAKRSWTSCCKRCAKKGNGTYGCRYATQQQSWPWSCFTRTAGQSSSLSCSSARALLCTSCSWRLSALSENCAPRYKQAEGGGRRERWGRAR